MTPGLQGTSAENCELFRANLWWTSQAPSSVGGGAAGPQVWWACVGTPDEPQECGGEGWWAEAVGGGQGWDPGPTPCPVRGRRLLLCLRSAARPLLWLEHSVFQVRQPQHFQPPVCFRVPAERYSGPAPPVRGQWVLGHHRGVQGRAGKPALAWSK